MSASQPRDPAIISQQPLATQAFLAPTAIEWLLVCFAHDRQLFAEARDLIASHHFKPHETPLRLLYDALCLSFDQYGGATYETLADIVSNMIQQNQTIVLTEMQQEIIFRRDDQGLIWQVCNPTGISDEAANQSFARDLLRRFANERTIVEPLRRVMNPGFNQGVPDNLHEFLDVIKTQQARLSTLSAIPEFELVPAIGAPLVQSNQFLKTGVSFIDETIGGMRIGDANGIIGPTGGGKTTLAVHMAVEIAKQCWVESVLTGKPPKIVVFITAEEQGIKLRPRIWSSFFRIPREKLETMTDFSRFTTPGNLAQYERELQSNQEYQLSEMERYQLYGPQLASCLKVLDLSGSDEFPTAGTGYVPEIVSYLSRYSHSIAAVFIDYAGIFCERYMAAQGMDEKNYRYLLKTFGDRCRQEISAQFGCTTWVLHQLKGSMGKSSPSKLMHHSDAGESADFANNMVVCCCLGVADTYTGCRRLNFSKVRYMASANITPPTLRINDQFAIMEDVTRLFTISPSGQFLTMEDRNQIRGMEGVEQRQLPTGGPSGMRDTSTPLNASQQVDV